MKNKTPGFWLGIFVWVGLLVFSPMSTRAFALLGPVQPWMQATNGVVYPDDIGGPMELTNEYRWNVPVVTYGFDQSFLDFFGSNGVAAVEGAIQILNDLPPASQIVLTNYPLDSRQANYAAQAQSLLDLKSETLSLLLQQLGLAQPTRNIYVIRDWNPAFFAGNGQTVNIEILGMPIYYESTGIDPGAESGNPGYVTNFVAGFNFDPQNLDQSVYVNDTLYAGYIYINSPFGQNFVEPFSVDPLASVYSALADFGLASGTYYAELTRDDAGGLRYLLSTNNVNHETLLSDVQAIASNSLVNAAWRPGVDKITFVPQSTGLQPGTFLPMTNQFNDVYITNGEVVRQQLQRVTDQPDFLFSAGNDFFCTGTTNWVNNANVNGNFAGAGPGIIRPPVKIVFQKLGDYYYNSDSPVSRSEDSIQSYTTVYGSFDGSSNAPIVYPVPQSGNISMSVRVILSHSNFSINGFKSFEWLPASQAGTVYALQTSTNLSSWNTLFTVTNNGSVCTYQNVNANSPARFYRLIPQ